MLENLKPPVAPSCRIMAIADGLEAKDRQIFLGAVNDPDTWPIKTLVRELGKYGISLGAETVRKHRNRGCGCP